MKGFETINQREFLALERVTKEYYEYFTMFDVESLLNDGEFITLTFENSTLRIRYDLHLQRIEYVMEDKEYIMIHSVRDKVLSESCKELTIDEIDKRHQCVEVTGNGENYRFYYDFEVERNLETAHEGGIVTHSYYEYVINNLRLTSVDREQDNGEYGMVNFCLKPEQKSLLLESIKNELYEYYNEIN
jgi:hypothetical protein